MSSIVTDIVVGVVKALPDLLRGGKAWAERRRLKEDATLAKAIKAGDWQTVAKIKERRLRYKDLVMLLVVLLPFFSGCIFTTAYRDVPLTEGDSPWPLANGVYEARDGSHHKATNSWVVSEADLYRGIREEGESSPSSWMTWLDSLMGLVKTPAGAAAAGSLGTLGPVLAWLLAKRRKRAKGGDDEHGGGQAVGTDNT